MFAKNALFAGLIALGVSAGVSQSMADEKPIWKATVQPAPQILGLMATGVPQPLVCNGAFCMADLASYCLQPERGEPWPGHPYEAVLGSDIKLLGTRADGSTVSVDAAAYAKFAANVAMTAVRVSIGREVLLDLGVKQLSIQVGQRVSLLPVPQEGDPKPLTEEEIALATGPARKVGVEFFEDGGPVGVTARLNAALLTLTPRHGRLSPAERDALWDKAMSSDLLSVATPDGLKQSRATYETCMELLGKGLLFSMRDCMERRHGRMMRKRNRELRNNLKALW